MPDFSNPVINYKLSAPNVLNKMEGTYRTLKFIFISILLPKEIFNARNIHLHN